MLAKKQLNLTDMKKMYILAALMVSMIANAAQVPSGELFATYQKQGDTFYRGNTTIDEENPDAKDLDINYYIVSLGSTMLFRAVNPGEDINFDGAGWAVQLRVYNNEGGAGSEVQACTVVDQHHHFTGEDCQTKINAKTEDLQIHFFLSSNVDGGYRRTATIEYNRASINNPIDDAVAPVINAEEISMDEEDGDLVFTFGDVQADEPYFFYVADKDHNIGAISLSNKVVIAKPTVQDGTTYTFSCYAVDYNGNKSASRNFSLVMPFDPNVDLARDKTAKAGAVQNDNTPDKAVNGNPDNFWTCFGQGDESTSWWSVDLNNAYKINRIKIHFNDVWEKFSILSSLDEQSWTPVLADQDAENNSTMDYSVAITARYLKVQSAGVHLGIREFEVYGTGLDDSTSTEIISSDSRNNVQKILLNGQLYILRGDACYTLTGTELR